MADLTNLVTFIAQALVDRPEEVRVTEVKGDQTSVIELRVAKEDMGKVIGKMGRTAKAIRTVVNAAATKQKRHTVLEIVE